MIMGTWTSTDGLVSATLHEDATWKVTSRWPSFNDQYLDMLSIHFPPERLWSYGPQHGERFAVMLADVVAAFGGTMEYEAGDPQDEDGEVVKF